MIQLAIASMALSRCVLPRARCSHETSVGPTAAVSTDPCSPSATKRPSSDGAWRATSLPSPATSRSPRSSRSNGVA